MSSFSRDRLLRLADLRKAVLPPPLYVPMAPAEILAVKRERVEEAAKKHDKSLPVPPPSAEPIDLESNEEASEEAAMVAGEGSRSAVPSADKPAENLPFQRRTVNEVLMAPKANTIAKLLSASVKETVATLPSAPVKETVAAQSVESLEGTEPQEDEEERKKKEKKKEKKKKKEETKKTHEGLDVSRRVSEGVITFSGGLLPKRLSVRNFSKGPLPLVAEEKGETSITRTPRGSMLPFVDLLHTPGFFSAAENEVEEERESVESLRAVNQLLQRENDELKSKVQVKAQPEGTSEWSRAVNRQLVEMQHINKVLMSDVAMLKQAILPPEGSPKDSWATMKAEVLEGGFALAARRGWLRPRAIRDPLFRHYFTHRWDEVRVALVTDSSTQRKVMKKRKRAAQDPEK